MFIRQKFRIYPTKQQQSILNRWIGSSRFVWNHFLSKNIEQYKQTQKFIFYNDCSKQLTQLKRTEQCSWLKDIDSTCLQQKLRDLDKAIKQSFKNNVNKKGFPHFKAKKLDESGVRLVSRFKIDTDNNTIRLPKIDTPIKAVIHQPLKGVPSSVTVVKNRADQWFISLVVDWNVQFDQIKVEQITSAVGVDVGIKTFAVISDGTQVQNPKHYHKAEKRLRKLQRKHSKKRKNSKNREKSRKRLAKQHRKVANKRSDFVKQTAAMIAKSHDLVVCEDLNVKGMVKNHKLSKSISDCGWGMFLAELRWQCTKRGKIFHQISRWFASSQTCNFCGYVNKDLTLEVRHWVCPNCNASLDRDFNASQNILTRGLVDLHIVRRGPSEFTRTTET